MVHVPKKPEAAGFRTSQIQEFKPCHWAPSHTIFRSAFPVPFEFQHWVSLVGLGHMTMPGPITEARVTGCSACPSLGERSILSTTWPEMEKDSFPKKHQKTEVWVLGSEGHSWAPHGGPRHGRPAAMFWVGPSSEPGQVGWPCLQHLRTPSSDLASSLSRLFWSKHVMRGSSETLAHRSFPGENRWPTLFRVLPVVSVSCHVDPLGVPESQRHRVHATLGTDCWILFFISSSGS